jgi:hypothetical protein
VQKPNGQFVLPVFIRFSRYAPYTDEYCQSRFNVTLAGTVNATVLICISPRPGRVAADLGSPFFSQ